MFSLKKQTNMLIKMNILQFKHIDTRPSRSIGYFSLIKAWLLFNLLIDTE